MGQNTLKRAGPLQSTAGQLQVHTLKEQDRCRAQPGSYRCTVASRRTPDGCDESCDLPISVDSNREAAGDSNINTLLGLVVVFQGSNATTSKGSKVEALRPASVDQHGDLMTEERDSPPRAGKSFFPLCGGRGSRCRQAASKVHVSTKRCWTLGLRAASRALYSC